MKTQALRFLLIGLALIPLYYFAVFTGLLGIPAYLSTPDWVTNSLTTAEFDNALKAEIPLGMEKWKFVEKMKKSGFKPGWGRTASGHFGAVHSFYLFPCSTEHFINWDTDNNNKISYLQGNVTKACL